MPILPFAFVVVRPGRDPADMRMARTPPVVNHAAGAAGPVAWAGYNGAPCDGASASAPAAMAAGMTSRPARVCAPPSRSRPGRNPARGGGDTPASAPPDPNAQATLTTRSSSMQRTSRRHFLRATAAGIAGMAALDRVPAHAQKRELTFLSWNHFVP